MKKIHEVGLIFKCPWLTQKHLKTRSSVHSIHHLSLILSTYTIAFRFQILRSNGFGTTFPNNPKHDASCIKKRVDNGLGVEADYRQIMEHHEPEKSRKFQCVSSSTSIVILPAHHYIIIFPIVKGHYPPSKKLQQVSILFYLTPRFFVDSDVKYFPIGSWNYCLKSQRFESENSMI